MLSLLGVVEFSLQVYMWHVHNFSDSPVLSACPHCGVRVMYASLPGNQASVMIFTGTRLPARNYK